LALTGALAAGLSPFGAWLRRVPSEGDAIIVADGFLPLVGVGFVARAVALAPDRPGLVALLLLLGAGNALVAARSASNDEPGSFPRAVGCADAALAFLGLIAGTAPVVAASVLVVGVGVLGRALARQDRGWPGWLGGASLAGFPGLAGFTGRWLFLAALVAAGRPALALVAFLALFLVGYGVFRGAGAASPPGEVVPARTDPGSWLAAAVLVGIGLAPGGWLGVVWSTRSGAPTAGPPLVVVTLAMFLALLPILLAARSRPPLAARRRRPAGPGAAEVLWDAMQRLAERAAGPARAVEERYSLALGLLVAVAALYALGG
jgi:hypothetical protein